MESTTKVYGPIWIDPDRMSGVPCFTGTRIRIEDLFGWLDGGSSVDEFIAEFNHIKREQVIEVLKLAKDLVTTEKLLDAHPA